MHAGESFPDDIGATAARAYLDALTGESEALALRVGVDSLRNHLRYLRETEAEIALEALGTRLTDFLAEVRKVAADLKDARSADEAIQAGGRAPAAWRTLTDMVGRLRAIREAQFDTLRPLGDGQRLQQLRNAGHFELAGLRHDEVPADILTALQSGYYDVPSLVYLANSDSAWVPSSYEALEDEDVMPDVGIPDIPVHDVTPTVTPISEPPAPKRHGHEYTPDLRLK
ncbi:hypothetical protein BGM19_07845 [Streptomyces agglomeratus]|nr:hypothetical protein BGM19_07845 [Streptomyces agglomeratus]